MAGFRRAKRGAQGAQAPSVANPVIHDSQQFWFNTKTLKVEVGLKAPAVFRIGPFGTEAEAANALELVKRRAQEWSSEESANDA
jgi:hypothetical protein